MLTAVHQAEEAILSRKWFYRYTLPSGRATDLYISDEIHTIHETRLRMMFDVLDPMFEQSWAETTCIDLASHQGYFAYHLSKKAKHVLGIDFQDSHIEDSGLIKQVYGLDNCEFMQANIATLDTSAIEPADIVTMLGLLYNLEDPIGVLRKAKRLTKKVLLVETQTTGLDLTGRVDSGTYRWGNEMHGIFGVFAGFTGQDGAATDIILYPSPTALVWVLQRIGFSRVEILTPPPDAYEQLASGKRVMVAAYL